MWRLGPWKLVSTPRTLAAAVIFFWIAIWAAAKRDPLFPDDADHADRPLLVVHVGPPKTASTSLQERLCEWEARLAESNVTVFTPLPSGKCSPKKPARVALALAKLEPSSTQGYKELMAAVAGLKPGQTLVFSSEYLARVPGPEHLRPFAEAVRASGADVAVAAVFRRWAGKMASWYGHNAAVDVRKFRGSTFAAFRIRRAKWAYRRFLATWLGAFPEAYVSVVSLEASLAPRTGKRPTNPRPISAADATFAAFLEWATTDRPQLAGNAPFDAWKLEEGRRRCAAAKAAEMLRGKLPMACGSLAGEAAAADRDDLEALRETRRRARGRLRLVNFPAGGRIELPAPIEQPVLDYCEVDRGRVEAEPEKYAGLVKAAAAEVAASCAGR